MLLNWHVSNFPSLLMPAFKANNQIKISDSMASLGAMPKILIYCNPVLFSGENCFKVFNTLRRSLTSKETYQDQVLSVCKLKMQSVANGFYRLQISSTSILQGFKILNY